MIACEGFHDALTPAVFTQTLGWSAEQYSRLQGGWGLLGRILGAMGGGYVCDRLGRRLTLGVASGISTAAFAALRPHLRLVVEPELPARAVHLRGPGLDRDDRGGAPSRCS